MTKINGTAGDDVLIGGTGDDIINGKGGDDSLYGGDGADSLLGGGGADALSGGAGDDLLDGGDGNDTLDGGTGLSTLLAGAGDDVLFVNFDPPTDEAIGGLIDGGDGEDFFEISLNGVSGPLTINFAVMSRGGVAHAGPFDIVNCERGTITLSDGGAKVATGDLEITVNGGLGADRITGGAADNVFDGVLGADRISGKGGADYLTASLGSTLIGGGGDDHLYDYEGHSRLSGGGGDDEIAAGGFAQTLSGGAGHDSILLALGSGEAMNIDLKNLGHGMTIAFADPENDILLSGFESAELDLSYGADHVLTRAIEASIGGGAGDDYIQGASARLVAYGGAGNDTLLGGLGDDFLIGGDDDDQIRGGAGADDLNGGSGRDSIQGGGGDDYIETGQGDDLMSGGAGADTFHFLERNLYFDQIRITDLGAEDTLDLSAIDADVATETNEAFRVVSAFDGGAGEMVVVYDAGTKRTTLELDVRGFGEAQAVLILDGDHRDLAGIVL